MIVRYALRISFSIIFIWWNTVASDENASSSVYYINRNPSVRNGSDGEEFQLRNFKKLDILPPNYTKKIRLKNYGNYAGAIGGDVGGIRVLKKPNKFYKNSTNKHVLTKLGVRKIPFDSNDYLINNNKAESNLLIVKLPPNPYYYINLEPCDDQNNKNCINKSSKNLNFNFNINGKPNKIYHYNLPVISRAEKRSSQNKTRSSSVSKVLSHKRQATGENDISLYQPLPNKYTISNYYKGNGRFQSLYVINKKKKKKYPKPT